MKIFIKRRWIVGMAVFALTAGQLCTMVEPRRRRSRISPFRPIESQCAAAHYLRGQTHRRALPFIPGRSTYINRQRRLATCFTSCLATAGATVRSAIPACAVAMRDITGPSVPPAPKRPSLPTARPSWARLRLRFALPSAATNTRASTWKRNRRLGKTGRRILRASVGSRASRQRLIPSRYLKTAAPKPLAISATFGPGSP